MDMPAYLNPLAVLFSTFVHLCMQSSYRDSFILCLSEEIFSMLLHGLIDFHFAFLLYSLSADLLQLI